MDWDILYCPRRHCRGYGKPFAQGYLVKNGPSRGQPRAWCTACEARVVLRYGTAYDGLEADPVIFETAVRARAEGNALRATARIVHVDKDTVCTWLHRVACRCRTYGAWYHPPRQGRLSQTAAATTSQSAVCPGRQTAQERTHGGGEHTGGLRNPRSGGSKFGPLACQLGRQHQFCRAGQLDTASESPALHTAHDRVLQGPDVVRDTTVVGVGV